MKQGSRSFGVLSCKEMELKPVSFDSARVFCSWSLRAAVLLLIGLCDRTTAAFQSTTAPRFDRFAEQLLGEWKHNPTTERTDTCSTACCNFGTVEEVIRSCGGAVQGIREVAVSNNLEGLYLNRANDGFVYWNDGTYSFGPTYLQPFERSQFSTSLALSKSYRALSALTLVRDDSQRIAMEGWQVHCLSRPVQQPNSKLEVVPTAVESGNKLLIVWHSQIRGRMPCPCQPWMLPCVQWCIKETEGATKEPSFEGEGRESESKVVQAWAHARHVTDGGIEFSTGVWCATSGLVKEVRRLYKSNGLLEHVMMLEGSVQ
jgi:hypothetical protein